MSLDVLSNFSKEIVSKKDTTTDSKENRTSKKEGSSLFDSLMKGIQREKEPTSLEKSSKESTKTENNDKKVNVEEKANQSKEKEGALEASKKVSEGLVDLVVDKAKSKSKEELATVKNEKTTDKTTITKTNEEIKTKVDGKANLIKEAVDGIKNEISKIGKEDKDNSNEITKTKVDEKANLIKETVDGIKNEISKIGKEDKDNSNEITKTSTNKENNEKTTDKTTITITKTNEEIKTKVDGKANLIKEAVDGINNEISKIENNTSSSNMNNNIENNVEETSKNSISKKQILVDAEVSKSESKIDGKTTLLANGFLNSQQKNKQTVSLSQISNAKDNIEKNKTLKSIKDSANMLDLNIGKVNVEHSDESGKVKKIDLLSKDDKASQLQRIQNQGVNRFILEKENMVKNEQLMNSAEIDKISSDNSQQKEKSIILNVPQTVVETIQSKIIGAQQKVGSFMSEVARNMYLNYKPPFTSFRMNLNPANLGSIAVVMRASKTDNSVSVSMNMNNNSTMEVMAENKIALQTALQKQLGDGSNVSLSFDMQDGSNTEQFGQSNQNNSSSGQKNTNKSSEESTQVVLEDENIEELDYM